MYKIAWKLTLKIHFIINENVMHIKLTTNLKRIIKIINKNNPNPISISKLYHEILSLKSFRNLKKREKKHHKTF